MRNVPPTPTPISARADSTRSRAVPVLRRVRFSMRMGASRTSHGFAWGPSTSTSLTRDYTRSRETTMGNLDPDDWRASVVEEVLVDSPIAHEDPDFASLLEGVRILLSPHEAGQ